MARNRTAVFLTKNPIFYARDYNESFGSTAQAIIFVQDSEGNFTIPLNLDAPLLCTSFGQNYQFSLNQILNSSSVFEKIPYPESENLFRAFDNVIKQYQVQTKILGTVEAPEVSETFLAMKGKIEKNYYKTFGLNLAQTFMDVQIGRLRGFLSNAPVLKRTSLKSTEFLNFACNINPLPEVIQIVAYVIDTFGRSQIILYDTITPIQNQVLEINVSYNKIRELANADLERYKIHLQEPNGNKISEPRTYIIDPVEYEDEEEILFKNLFGVWDSARVLARRTEGKEAERLTFENENYERFDYFQQGYDKFTVRTGPMEQGFLSYLAEELIFSPEIYFKNARVNCLTNSLEVYNPVAYIESAALEFRAAQTDIY